jgi:hypothetical protein
MYKYGGDNCINEFYHTWFTNGSALWDRVGISTYGPAPGFLTGGPNPSYNVDGCCPGSCGSAQNNALCTSENLTPPRNQPRQKSYKDFNTSWPLNSWSVTENSCGYQVNYIRLLSKFVNPQYDCSGVLNGGAKIDECGRCSGGNTGINPVNDPRLCNQTTGSTFKNAPFEIKAWLNQSANALHIEAGLEQEYRFDIFDLRGITVAEGERTGTAIIEINSLQKGYYLVQLTNPRYRKTLPIVIL